MTSDEILAKVDEFREKQTQLELEWKSLRSIAQEDCCRIIHTFRFTAQELGFNVPKDAAVKPARKPRTLDKAARVSIGVPRYQNPDGPETWTGVGKRPLWFRAAEEAGFSRADMEIPGYAERIAAAQAALAAEESAQREALPSGE